MKNKLILAFALALTLGCEEKSGDKPSSSSSDDSSSSVEVSSSSETLASSASHTFKTVKIGNQVWMAENINIDIESNGLNGNCYENEQANCRKYGRLYDFETANSLCPSGWHLPSDEDWQTLVDFAGGKEIAGKKLKAKHGWNENGNGTDEFGFSALPGGYAPQGGDYELPYINIGVSGGWWSSSEGEYSLRNYWSIDHNKDEVYQGVGEYWSVFSVRCVKE